MKTLTTKQAIIIAAVGLAGIYGIKKVVSAVRKYKEQANEEAGLANGAVDLSVFRNAQNEMSEATTEATDTCCEKAYRHL